MTEIPFETALKRGLGRAVLMLRESSDNTAYREAIQHACCTNLAYDRYTERGRDRYLTDILEASNDLEWHLPRLRKALADPDTYFDQLALICARLTGRGLADLRTALYSAWKDWFWDLEDGTHFDGAEALILLDGVEGWRFVQRTLLTAAPTKKSSHIEYALYWELGERVGVKAARHAGDEEPVLRGEIVLILAEERQRRIERLHKESEPLPTDLPAVQKVLSGELGGPSPGRLGRELDDALIHQLALAMPDKNDVETLRRWLRVFGCRAFPLEPTPLLALLEHSNPRIYNKAFFALCEMTHPAIRALAEQLVAGSDNWRLRIGSLLARNPGDNDIELLSQVFSVCKADEEIHQFGFGLKDYYDKQPDKIPLALFETLYEQTPCPMCRHSFVRILQERDRLPAWITDEAKWDADEETRYLVSSQEGV